MIGRIHGKLLEKSPPHILVLTAGGVAYELDVPMSTLYDLPETGVMVELLTHMVVREDAQLLFGFLSRSERDAFRQLLKVSGVGPRLALAVLSGLSVDELAECLLAGDVVRLAKTPGVGKRTAERLVLELSGKLQLMGPAKVGGRVAALDDIEQALLALGYGGREITATIKTLPDGVTVPDGIRLALKALSKV